MIQMTAIATLLFLISTLAFGQSTQPPLTNADVMSMAKSGIGEETILLAIQQGASKFDTSPQALVDLKRAGVGDKILSAMLTASHASPNAKGSDEKPSEDGRPLLQKALDAIGPADKVAAVHSVKFKMSITETVRGVSKSLQRESVRVYPEKSYMHTTNASGQSQTQVITPDFNYRETGKMTSAVPSEYLQNAFAQMEMDRFNIAHHPADCTAISAGDEDVGGLPAQKLKIECGGRGVVWKIDAHTGHILTAEMHLTSGDIVTEFSDYREVDGISVPFKHRISEGGNSSDQTLSEVVINPAIDETIFDRPKTLAAEALTFKVLQAESVPYTQESGGGVNTTCNISGSSNSTATVNSYGNTAYGNGSTTSDMRMNCNSYDTTIRWQHVLNTMFIEASDGNAYIIACDRAWRWSKCVPLRTGQTFNARFTGKGIEVQAFNTKGKEDEPVYRVLQSKAMK